MPAGLEHTDRSADSSRVDALIPDSLRPLLNSNAVRRMPATGTIDLFAVVELLGSVLYPMVLTLQVLAGSHTPPQSACGARLKKTCTCWISHATQSAQRRSPEQK